MRRCSLWMRRRRSRRSTARIRCCHCLRDAPSGTALSTSGTARCPCTRRSTPRQARCSARRPRDTRLRSSSRSWPTSEGSLALHPDLLLVAQPDRTLVRQDRARHHCPRRVHVVGRLAEKAHEVHPALQQGAKDRKVVLLRSYASHHSQFSRYSPRDTPECGRVHSIADATMTEADLDRKSLV